MTPDELRAAIAADCPHRLDDYDRHRAAAGRNEGAFLALWRTEYAVSSQPDVEARIDQLYAQAVDSDLRDEAMAIFAEINQIREQAVQAIGMAQEVTP